MKKFILFMLCGLLQACSPPETEVVSEMPSSDGRFKAVWVLMETFATDGFRYSLHLVENQSTEIPEDHRPVLKTDDIDKTQVQWTGPESLAVQCTPGKVFYFSNFSDVGETRLEVGLNTDCSDAPPR